jgi:hypothetical protein
LGALVSSRLCFLSGGSRRRPSGGPQPRAALRKRRGRARQCGFVSRLVRRRRSASGAGTPVGDEDDRRSTSACSSARAALSFKENLASARFATSRPCLDVAARTRARAFLRRTPYPRRQGFSGGVDRIRRCQQPALAAPAWGSGSGLARQRRGEELGDLCRVRLVGLCCPSIVTHEVLTLRGRRPGQARVKARQE